MIGFAITLTTNASPSWKALTSSNCPLTNNERTILAKHLYPLHADHYEQEGLLEFAVLSLLELPSTRMSFATNGAANTLVVVPNNKLAIRSFFIDFIL